jgi:hypothetical protein
VINGAVLKCHLYRSTWIADTVNNCGWRKVAPSLAAVKFAPDRGVPAGSARLVATVDRETCRTVNFTNARGKEWDLRGWQCRRPGPKPAAHAASHKIPCVPHASSPLPSRQIPWRHRYDTFCAYRSTRCVSMVPGNSGLNYSVGPRQTFAGGPLRARRSCATDPANGQCSSTALAPNRSAPPSRLTSNRLVTLQARSR